MTICDEFHHLRNLAEGGVEEFHLVAGADEVVLRVLDLVVGVAAYVVGEEPYCLHEWEQTGGVWQILPLDRGEERLCPFQIASCEGFEDLHVEIDLVQFRRILGHRVGGGAQEVPEVGEHIAWHHGVQIDDAEDLAVLVEHHVVDLRVAVAYSFRKLSLTVQLLGLAHLDPVFVDVFQYPVKFLISCLVICMQTSGPVLSDSLDQLPEPQLHVVEVRNRLSERVRDVGKHRLEVAESLAGVL